MKALKKISTSVFSSVFAAIIIGIICILGIAAGIGFFSALFEGLDHGVATILDWMVEINWRWFLPGIILGSSITYGIIGYLSKWDELL